MYGEIEMPRKPLYVETYDVYGEIICVGDIKYVGGNSICTGKEYMCRERIRVSGNNICKGK